MRLEMVIGIQNEILDGGTWFLFSNEPYEKKPVMIIEDFVFNSDDHFESHLLGNGLYIYSMRFREIARHKPISQFLLSVS